MTPAPQVHTGREAGFTLIEALIALLVMAFGMLAVAGMQITLSRNSDVAKQRSEAVRLGQKKVEELRAYQQVESDGKTSVDAGNIFDYALDVVSGTDTVVAGSAFEGDNYASNTTFLRTWSVTQNDGVTAAVGTDLEKWIQVRVQWADRTAQTSTAYNQEVTLRSVISRSDPVDLGILFTGPGGAKTRSPKNRNINIPYPAVDLAGKKTSAFQPPGSGSSYVFDNTTGDVLGFCTGTLTEGQSIDLDDTDGTITSGCTVQKAYILSGYVRFLNSMPGGTEKNQDNGISNPSADITKELTVALSFVGTAPPTPACFTQRQKVVNVGSISSKNIANASRTGSTVTVSTSGNHGFETGQFVSINNTGSGLDGVFQITKLSNTSFSYTLSTGNSTNAGTATLIQEITLAEGVTAPTGYNTVTSRFVAYTCVVRPYDDSDPNTRDKWSGQFVITPQPTAGVPWVLGSGTGEYKVCRYSGDYKNDNTIANSEHPLIYRGVSATLDSQNYLVLPNTESCPTDDEAAPLSDDYINVHTILHQTTSTGAAPYGGLPSDTSAQWSSGGETGSEPSDAVFPMF